MGRLVPVGAFGADAVEDILLEGISILLGAFGVLESFHEVRLLLGDDFLVA